MHVGTCNISTQTSRLCSERKVKRSSLISHRLICLYPKLDILTAVERSYMFVYSTYAYAFTVQLPHARCWSLDRMKTALCFYRATSSCPMLEFGSYGNSFMLLLCNFLMTDVGVWIVWKHLFAFTVQLPHDRCWSLDRMETALCFYRATSS